MVCFQGGVLMAASRVFHGFWVIGAHECCAYYQSVLMYDVLITPS